MRNQFEPAKLPTFEPLKPLTLPNLNQPETQSVPAKQSFQEFAMAGGGVPAQYKGREHVWHAKVGKHEISMKKGGDPLDEFVPPRFRSAGRRPAGQDDRKASASMPVDFARGAISGALGAPGDIESLVRMLPGFDEKTFLPTSEDIEKRLPFRSDTPQGRMASGLGTLAGGFYTGPGSPFNVAAKGAKLAGEGLGTLKGSGAGAKGLAAQRGVVKMPGGNWLEGTIEKGLRSLKPYASPTAEDKAFYKNLREIHERKPPSEQRDRSIRAVDEDISTNARNEALNEWVDRNLSNYVKKQMGTPDDPIRALAEQGISHLPADAPMSRYMDDVRARREKGGFPAAQGTSRQAQVWESLADEAIRPKQIGETIRPNNPGGMTMREMIASEPGGEWANKAPDTQMVHEMRRPGTSSTEEIPSGLGFDHIMDVLRTQLSEGTLRPEQMSKISISDAVRRTHQFDEDMAKKMAEAQIKATEGMPVHKEYPEGYKWIELTAPKGKLAEGYSLVKAPEGAPDKFQLIAPDGRKLGYYADEAEASVDAGGASEKALEAALKYEGETMGHCVGGYCPDVMEGRSRIYSLRDAKGEPHVTVEVQPNKHLDFNKWFASQPQELRNEINARARRGEHGGSVFEAPEYLAARKALPPRIQQIKGKQNRAPKEEYLPYVQDFVKGGKWSDVGDIQNTGLIKHDSGKYISKAEMDALSRKHFGESVLNKPDASESPEQYFRRMSRYDPELLTDIDKAFLEDWKAGNFPATDEGMAHGGELHMAGGGLAKILGKGLKAAKQAVPLVEAPSIIVPKGVSSLKEAARQSKGEYGARRVERAADEIPNLEKMYKDQALREAFLGDNAKAVVTMNPADFERYAQILKGRTKDDIGPKMAELAKQGEIDKYTVPIDEYIQHLMRVEGGFEDVPYLNLYKDEVGLPSKPEVRGHEGRHRSRALSKAGETKSLVHINPRGDLREGLPRRSQEEYIKALREELERSGRLVLPEVDGSYSRPAVEFPEPYAKGGDVKPKGGLSAVTKSCSCHD